MAHARGALNSCCLHCFEKRGCQTLQPAVIQPFTQHGGAHFGGLGSHMIHLPSLHGEERSAFLGLLPHNDMVNSKSVVGFKPDDSGLVIGYQIEEFTCIWSAEHFVI